MRRACFVLMSALLLGALVWAQDKNKGEPTVKLNVLVLDSKNQPVTNLRQEDFIVTEGGKPQTISSLSSAALPLRYGLVMDTSGSLRTQKEMLGDAAFHLINALKPEDEAFVIGFVNQAVIAQELTNDKSKLAEGVNQLSISGGQTALVDAVYLSADYLNKKKTTGTRPALILVTDGEERASYYTADQLVDLLHTTDIQIFVIGLVQKLEKDDGGFTRKSAREKAEDLLDRLTKETGGRVFYPKDRQGVQKAAEEIMLSLRSQYVIGYVPGIPPKVKQYRKVEVKLADKGERKVFTRRGYTLTEKP